VSESILLAGKRGSGKTLGAMQMISDYLKEGRPVATNIDLFVEHLVPAWCETRWYRLPDFPSADDLFALPLGNPEPQKEKRNGLLVLDEVGNFLAARQWAGEDRQKIINWLSQSRKFGWDLLLMAQHINMVDKQVREAFVEVQGTVRRLDKIRVPLLSMIVKYFTGKSLHFPRLHVAPLRYGFGPDAPISERFIYRGVEFFGAYNTLQKINPETGQRVTTHMLSAWELKGRSMSQWDIRRQMAAGGLVIGILLGFAGGYAASYFKPWKKPDAIVETIDPAVKVRGVVKDSSGRDVVLLTDGRTAVASGVRVDSKGTRYQVGASWYAN
jgi:hypothetical protein